MSFCTDMNHFFQNWLFSLGTVSLRLPQAAAHPSGSFPLGVEWCPGYEWITVCSTITHWRIRSWANPLWVSVYQSQHEITPHFSGINAQEFKSWVPTVNPYLVLKGTAHLFSREAVPLYILTAMTEESRCSASSVLSTGYPLATPMTKCVMVS